MILEDVMKDGRRVTFDCVFQKKGEMATIGGGVNRIEIDDCFYGEKEVQGAIRQNLVKVVGEAPAIVQQSPKAEERKFRLRNAWTSKITIDCIRDYVDPGKVISVAESVLLTEEVRNALEAGMLVDADAPAAPPQAERTAAVLTEFVAEDIIPATAPSVPAEPAIVVPEVQAVQPAEESPVEVPAESVAAVIKKASKAKAEGVAGKRVRAKATSPIKAKKVGAISAHDSASPLDLSSDDDGSLFSESKLAVRKETPEPPKPKKAEVSKEVMDFIFGEDK